MQTLILPALHSHSDLITNSSSETFVCNSDITNVETVKSIISILWDEFLRESERLLSYNIRFKEEYLTELQRSNLFGDIFNEPYFSKWSFDLYHDLLFGDFYHLYNVKNSKEIFSEEFEQRCDEFDDLVDKFEEGEDTEETRYNTFFEFFKPAIDAFTTWFYTVCLPENGFAPNTDTFKLSFEFSTWCGLEISVNTESENPDHLEFQRFISQCICYKYDVRKDQLIINSTGDNSVPYNFFCKIEEVFSGTRIHLG